MSPEPDRVLRIDDKQIGDGHPTYFIADIAANHDGDLRRATDLIYLAAEAGADAAKFQHFQASTIVSDKGFRSLQSQQSHQASWKKSVFEVYKDAAVDLGWTPHLKKACDKAGITFFTSPYAPELVDAVDPYVPAYKIGSGDITWMEIIEYIAGKQKPYFLATGASTMADVERAVGTALAINTQFALLQCNTNYTASLENFKFIQLRVLETYRRRFPGMILGLSDHTPGHATRRQIRTENVNLEVSCGCLDFRRCRAAFRHRVDRVFDQQYSRTLCGHSETAFQRTPFCSRFIHNMQHIRLLRS